MSGAPDLYVQARTALLDAAEALAEQLDAVVLVGAQAVYLHTGDADFVATAPYTTDADFCIAPDNLSDEPLLHELLQDRGFSPGEQPGSWRSRDGIPVDLMVPEALAGPGSRGARLGPHGKRVARRAKGLEGTLVDRKRMEIVSLERDDDRSVVMSVAGRRRCSWPRSIRSPSAPEPRTESVTRTRWMSCVSCGPLKPRRSRHTWWTLPTTRSARRSPPKRCPNSRRCSVAQTRRESAWRSGLPAPRPRRT